MSLLAQSVRSVAFLAAVLMSHASLGLEQPTSPRLSIESRVLNGDDRSDAWREDLRYLADELPKRHKNLFAYQTQDWFREQIEKLDREIPNLTDDAIQYEMERIVAGLHEGHTRLRINLPSARYLPLNFYMFKEGVYVIAAGRDDAELFEGQVLKVGDATIEEVVKRLTPQIARDNMAGLKDSMPYYIQQANLLVVAGFWSDVKEGSITIQKDGQEITKIVRSLTSDEARQIEWVTKGDGLPLCDQKSNLSHWNDVAADKTLYFKYNRCVDQDAFRRLVDGTRGYIEQNSMKRFVVDLRHNGGGNSRIFHPLYSYLKNESPFNEKGKLFVVIGRKTYSSAILNALEMQETEAIFVGEPTGGRPNHYGEVKTFELPNSKLQLSYSTKYFRRVADNELESLQPEIVAEPSFEAWRAGKDPAMEAILKYSDE